MVKKAAKLSVIDSNELLGVNREGLSQFLSFEAFDEENNVFVSFLNEDRYIGKIYECVPFPFAGEEQIKTVSQIINSTLPKNSIIQFCLFADPRVDNILDNFIAKRNMTKYKKDLTEVALKHGINEAELEQIYKEMKRGNIDFFTAGHRLKYLTHKQEIRIKEEVLGISRLWIDKYAEFIREHKNKGFYPDMPVSIRNFRLFVVIKVPLKNIESYEKEIKLLKNVFSNIKSSLDTARYYAKEMNPQDILNAFYWVINPDIDYTPKYQDNISLKYQMVNKQTSLRWKRKFNEGEVYLNDRELSVLTCMDFPKKVHIFNCSNLLGSYMGEDLKQITCPFLLTLTVLKNPANKDVLFWVEKTFMQKGQGSVGFKIFSKQKEAADAVIEMDEFKEDFYYFTLNLILYSEKGRKTEDLSIVMSLWEKIKFTLIEETLYPITPFLFSLPFGAKMNKKVFNYLRDRLKVAPSSTISHIVPVQAEWNGVNCAPICLFVSRRGQLIPFDLFTGSETNFNAVVFAESGSGKSFFTNYMVNCYNSVGAKIWIIDIGRSYEKICKALGGDYIEFTPDSQICLNPFTYTTKIDESIDNLTALIAKMARPQEGCNDEEISFIKEAIKAVWEKFLDKPDDPTINDIAEYLSMRREPTAEKLAKLLSEYTTSGTYDHLFNGKANLDLSKSELTVLELEEIANIENLRNVILMLLMYQIQEEAYKGDKSVQKLVFIDEAWQFFSDDSSGMGKFIETGFRRIRKYNGSFIVITQGLGDFYDSEQIGKAILSNVAYQIILKQDPDVIKRLVNEKKLNIAEGMVNYMKSVKTIKGKYSEILLRIGGKFGSVGRLFVDPYTFALFTTDGAKVQYLQDLMKKKSMSISESITQALKTNYGMGKDDTVLEIPEFQQAKNKLTDYIESLPPDVVKKVYNDIMRKGDIYKEVNKKVSQQELMNHEI